MGPIGCPETSVNNYKYTLCNNPEARSSHLRHCKSLKTRPILFFSFEQQEKQSHFVTQLSQTEPIDTNFLVNTSTITFPRFSVSLFGRTALVSYRRGVMKSSLFWDVTQRRMVVTDVSGHLYLDCFTVENGNHTLS